MHDLGRGLKRFVAMVVVKERLVVFQLRETYGKPGPNQAQVLSLIQQEIGSLYGQYGLQKCGVFEGACTILDAKSVTHGPVGI